MKISRKIVELQSLAIAAISLANTRKLPPRKIEDLFDFSHKVKRLLGPVLDELDNLKAAEQPIIDDLKQKVFDEVKSDNEEEINAAYAIKSARNAELQEIVRRRSMVLFTKKEIEFDPIEIVVRVDFIDDLPKREIVSFNGTVSDTDPMSSYFLLQEEGIINVKKTTNNDSGKVQQLKRK